MSARSTKRVNGNYDVYATTVTVHGNLDIIGTTTTIETTNTKITDAIITLNQGESGAGVTTGYAGIEVDRGTSPKVAVRWNEGTQKWQITNDGTLYLDIAFGSLSVTGSDTWVQFNDGGTGFGSNVNFTFDKNTNTLTAGNITLASGSIISTVGTNANLVLDPNGSGYVTANAAVGLYYQAAPSSVASNVFIYANTPGAAGSGIYYVNTDNSDELISKKKAQLYAWIF